MLQMMLRPRWVLALLLALGIAAAFAALGQWQVERAVVQATVEERPTEDIRPFSGLAAPGEPTEQSATGQLVEVSGTFVPGDTVIIEGRLNGGVAGYWPVAHLEVTDGPAGGLPIALGWTSDEQAARDAADRFDTGIDPAEVVTVGGALPAERGAGDARRRRRPVRHDDRRGRTAHQPLGRLRRPPGVLRLRDRGRTDRRAST